jgi:single-strand DNA-binding protein
MAGYNRVILVGNLTHDPKLRYTPKGTAVCDLRMAVNTVRGGKGERKEDTLFIDVTVWDRTAEHCAEYLSKGRPVLVEGRLTMDAWDDRETGQKRTKIKVVADKVQFLGGKDKRSAPSAGERKPAHQEEPGDEGEEDEIPF